MSISGTRFDELVLKTSPNHEAAISASNVASGTLTTRQVQHLRRPTPWSCPCLDRLRHDVSRNLSCHLAKLRGLVDGHHEDEE